MRVGLAPLALGLGLWACGAADAGPPAATVLTPEGADHRYSNYSPDGTRIAYWAAAPDGWDLMVAGADLSEPRRVASSPLDVEAPALWSPDGTTLAYASAAASLLDVWTVPAAGGEPRRLTDMPGVEIPLMWHPAGDRVAFLASTEGGTFSTMVAPLSGGGSVRLLQDRRPAVAMWSPDGTRIAANHIEAGKWTIWLVDPEGRPIRPLTQEGFELIQWGTTGWSPDGREIAYTSRRTGTGDIWVVPVDSGAPRQLTRDVRDDAQPAWSPDGRWIAFISERGGQTDIWVVPAAGGPELRVTDAAAEEFSAQWVPGTSRLAFESRVTASGIWAMALDDGTERRLTPDSIRVGSFDLSPDSAEVVYTVNRGGGVSELHVVPLAGGPSRTLVPGPGVNVQPDWSPDGRWILFQSNRGGISDVWVVAREGGEPRRLTDWPTTEWGGKWSADSRWIYFVSQYEAKPLYDVWAVPPEGGPPRRVTRTGSVFGVQASRSDSEVFVMSLGARAGQFALGRVRPDGTVQTLWDRTNFLGHTEAGVFPGGDSVAVQVELPGGGIGSRVIPTSGGEGRPILGNFELVGDLSPDASRLLYFMGTPVSDLGVLAIQDGSTRRLTTTPEHESQARWTPDGKSVVFLRSSDWWRITTVDLTRLLGAGQ